MFFYLLQPESILALNFYALKHTTLSSSVGKWIFRTVQRRRESRKRGEREEKMLARIESCVEILLQAEEEGGEASIESRRRKAQRFVE